MNEGRKKVFKIMVAGRGGGGGGGRVVVSGGNIPSEQLHTSNLSKLSKMAHIQSQSVLVCHKNKSLIK